MSLGVIELRNYLIKPGMLEHFIDFYEAVLVSLQEDFTMTTLGQFRLEGQADRFVFMRGFEDLEARLRAETYFYEGPVWAKFGPVPNSLIEEYHNVHLLRPLGEIGELTCGRSTREVMAGLADGTLGPETGSVVVDLYRAKSGLRERLVEAFQNEIAPAYEHASIQTRGAFVAEMGRNEFTRHPAIQDPDELVVITAYASRDACRDQRAQVRPQVEAATKGLLVAAPESLVLRPTLRSVIRYMA